LIRARAALEFDGQKQAALLQATDIFCQNKITKAASRCVGNASRLEALTCASRSYNTFNGA
jgi:hypothetical protein